MEIKPNSQLKGTPQVSGLTRRDPNGAPRSSMAGFGASEALNQALATTPEVRSEEVARARALVADEHYPPDVLVQKIARLLALKWDQAE